MNFNWCYFPLEADGRTNGVLNPVPDFVIQNGDPWLAGNGWFNGDGLNTSLVTPWNTAPLLFDGVALPGDGAYLIGFQAELAGTPVAQETILFCGYNSTGNTDGLRVEYLTNGKIRFTLANRNFTDIVRVTRNPINNSMVNVFCYIDHRPAGVGVDEAYVYSYEDGTDINRPSVDSVGLSALGDIYPQQIDAATALIIGAMQVNGFPQAGTHFSSKIRRLHMMSFGSLPDDVPGNLAELMSELSKASMVPTPAIQQIASLSVPVLSRAFVRYA